MKPPKKILILGSLFLLAIVAATLSITLGAGEARSASLEASVQSALQAQGVSVASVRQDAATNTLEVALTSTAGGKAGDAWANTVIQREADFLAESGAIAVQAVAVTIVDGKGITLYHWAGPIDPRARPSGKAVDAQALAGMEPSLAAQAEQQGVTLKNLSISADPSQGTIVEADVIVTASVGDARDAQIRWATLEFLGQLRDYAEGPAALGVDLYRIEIQDANGISLVDYVVDPSAKTVRAWMAPEVTPVWALGGPSPLPAAPTAAP